MIKLYPLDKYVGCHFQETAQFHQLNKIWSTVNYEMIELESFVIMYRIDKYRFNNLN